MIVVFFIAAFLFQRKSKDTNYSDLIWSPQQTITKTTPTLKFNGDLEIWNKSKLKQRIHRRPKCRQKCNLIHIPGGYIYVQCALMDKAIKKIGRLMMIICDPVALCLIFICLVPIFYKKTKTKKNLWQLIYVPENPIRLNLSHATMGRRYGTRQSFFLKFHGYRIRGITAW